MRTLKMRGALRKPVEIYWSTGGLWWTHDPDDLVKNAPFMKPPEDQREFYEQQVKNGVAILTDPVGHTLSGSPNWMMWMNQPIEYPEKHGHHGIHAFMAAHAQNHAIYAEGIRRVNTSWKEFNDLLDTLNPEELGNFY